MEMYVVYHLVHGALGRERVPVCEFYREPLRYAALDFSGTPMR